MFQIPLLANLPMLSLHALQQTLRHQTFSAGDVRIKDCYSRAAAYCDLVFVVNNSSELMVGAVVVFIAMLSWV